MIGKSWLAQKALHRLHRAHHPGFERPALLPAGERHRLVDPLQRGPGSGGLFTHVPILIHQVGVDVKTYCGDGFLADNRQDCPIHARRRTTDQSASPLLRAGPRQNQRLISWYW